VVFAGAENKKSEHRSVTERIDTLSLADHPWPVNEIPCLGLATGSGKPTFLAFGPACNFRKPKPTKARPKPGLPGQAGGGRSLELLLTSRRQTGLTLT
jgi:hypothetical protein